MRLFLQYLTVFCFLAGITFIVFAFFLIHKICGFFILGLALLGVTLVLENNLERRF